MADVSQLVNLMDQLKGSPAPRGIGIRGGGAIREGWDVREDEDALCLKVDIPEERMMSRYQWRITLIIKGEGEAASATDGDEAEADNHRSYLSRIELTPNTYKIDGIEAEMKNGVLKRTVPKL